MLPPKDGGVALCVLDGQQRIASLYAVQKGLVYTHEGTRIDYKDICINLDLDLDVDEEIVVTEAPEAATSTSVFDLLNADITDLMTNCPDKQHLKRVDIYRKRLTGYDFSTIVMDSYPIDIAC
jgi:hypothetical protein